LSPSTRHDLWRVVRFVLGFAMTYALAWWVWDILKIDGDDVSDDDLGFGATLVWTLVMIAGVALTIAVDVVAERSRQRSRGQKG
jgi:hypothetical protein